MTSQSRCHSLNKLPLHHYKHETFTRLQHQSTYLKQLSKIMINKDQRAKSHLAKENKQALNEI